jgi:peptidoglycan/LPS O-acetylase OafA/YrhL
MLRILWRVGIVMCLALAALLLAVDASEYPGYSRPALRALLFGAVPLLVAGAVNLRALGAVRGWRGAALACNVALVAVALPMARGGGPPFPWLLLGTAVLLVACSVLSLRTPTDR